MKRSFTLRVIGLTAGLFVAILGANLVHDCIVLHAVSAAVYQAERPDRIEKLAFRQWKIDRAPVYPCLYSYIDDPRYPGQGSDLGSIYFEHERPAYIRWAEKQIP
jgi:hypothetical protein